MATITLRSAKGSPLTNAEVDDNFSNLNTELGQKESASNKGQASGYASLDGSGKVPSSQLPSYVDDVVEAANFLSLPGTGETGKIYVVLDTNKTYRWSGSAYVEISASPGSTDAVTEGSTNLYFTNARARGALSGNAPISYNSTSGAISHAVSGVTAGSYGSSTSVPVITVDATGHVTGVSTSSISGSLTFTGDVTGSGSTGSSTALTLANSGVVAGTYTKVTVDAKGRVTTGASLASGDLPTYTGTITSSQVTTALGFTPYNSSNPSGYITSSALSSYLPLSGGTLTGNLTLSGFANPHITLTTSGGSYSYVELYDGSSYGYLIKNASSATSNGVIAGALYLYTDNSKPVQIVHNGSPNAAFLSGGDVHIRGQIYAAGNGASTGSQVLHAGNYNSYSPTLTGGGASGTWGISISGTSAEVNSGRFSTTAGSYNNAYTWIQFGSSGGYGLYFPGSGAMTHFYPNSPATYGSAFIEGSKNSYWGIMYNTGAGNAGWMTNGNTTGFYNHSYGWKYYHESGRFYSSDSTYGAGNTWSMGLHNTQNPVLYSSAGGAMGLLGVNSSGSYSWQIYGDGSTYGFLQSAWGAWDIQKTVNGQLLLRVSSTDYTALHSGNYSSYALPLSGGTLSGTIYVGTSSSGSAARALRVGPSGGSPGSFGSYSGSWRSAIEIWDNAATRMLHLTPPDGTNYNYSSIKSTDAGLKIDVGANGGTNAVTIETTGAATLTSNLTMSSGGIGSNAWSAASANETSRILAPAGAAASWDNNPVGAIKIRLPIRYNNAMWRMTVKIYDYGASVSEYHIGTYSYADGGYQSAAYFIGSNYAPVRNVRFGNDGSYDCVWIGETNTVWSYPVVAVTDFSSGFRTSAASNFMNNWHISYVTSFGTVAQNLTPVVRLASGSHVDGNTILHAGNYTSYSPSLTGSGASGTWGINVTGTSGSISGYNNPTTAATANTIVYRDSGGDISGRYFFGVHFNQSSSNTENPSIAAFWTNSGSDNYNRKSSPAHVISQLGLLTTSNYGSYALPLTGGTVSGIVTARGFDGYGVGTNSGTSGDSYRWGYQEAGAWTHPYPDLVFGYHTGLKFGANTGYGGMRFYSDHPNISSTILFSIGNGDSHVRVANNLIVSGDSTGNEVYTNNWFRNNGSGGWYSQSYGYGLRFAEGEGATYGNVCTYGSGRNGWAGYGVTTSFYLMGRSGSDLGIYDLSYGWTMYTPYGSGRMSFGTSGGDASYRIYCSGSFYATGNVVAYSDRRVKENIVTIDGALDKVSRMRGVYYNRIDDEKKTRQVGVVAQEMNEVLPEAVTYGADVDEYGVSYGNIVGVLIEAIKELKSEVADLKSKLH